MQYGEDNMKDEEIIIAYGKIISVNDYPKSDLKEMFDLFKKTYIEMAKKNAEDDKNYRLAIDGFALQLNEIRKQILYWENGQSSLQSFRNIEETMQGS